MIDSWDEARAVRAAGRDRLANRPANFYVAHGIARGWINEGLGMTAEGERALREWYDFIGHPYPDDMIAPPDRALAPPEDAEARPRDWTEDRGHENGRYQNQCVICEKTFIGHKRRVVCRVCAPAPGATSTEESHE